jgi:hypothetical protein
VDQLTEVRWRRYGQDRVYIETADGTAIGHIDLQTETVVAMAPEHESTMAQCASRWLCPATESDATINLATLPTCWRALHAVGDRRRDIDHVVIGPAGVFTINTKCHSGGKAWVGERMVTVNGHRTDYLRSSRHGTQRAARLLSAACGFDVPVRAAIVFVGLQEIDVKQMPMDVHVTTRRRLDGWLSGLPTMISAAAIDAIHARARLASTWQEPEALRTHLGR